MSKRMKSSKTSTKRLPLNHPGVRPKGGEPFSQQDPKRRLGNFASAGEHARQGGRTTGIVGQRKQKFRTDNKKK